MCLITTWPEPRKAEADIVCYKHLIKDCDGYATPYIKIPVICHKGEAIEASGGYVRVADNGVGEVEDGCIHAYRDMPDGETVCNCMGSVIVGCVIPEGTEYYGGENGEICARKMVFTGEVWEPSMKSLGESELVDAFMGFLEERGLAERFECDVREYGVCPDVSSADDVIRAVAAKYIPPFYILQSFMWNQDKSIKWYDVHNEWLAVCRRKGLCHFEWIRKEV